LRRRAFAAVLVAALILNFAALAYLAYASPWLQSVLMLSPIHARPGDARTRAAVRQ